MPLYQKKVTIKNINGLTRRISNGKDRNPHPGCDRHCRGTGSKNGCDERSTETFATYTQEQVDKIFKAAATAADKARIPLAKMAVEETGMGVVEDKVIKNHYAAEYIYNAYKNTENLWRDRRRSRFMESKRLQSRLA